MTDRPVVLYATRGCPVCDAARSFLRERGVAFTDVEVREEAASLRDLVRLSGRAVVPTIVVGADVQVGWDAARVEDMLAHPLPPADDDLNVVFEDEEEGGKGRLDD